MRIIVGSIIGNEKNNYLEEWLENVQQYCDIHVVVEDGTTDGTREILDKHLEKYPGKFGYQPCDVSRFKTNEVGLRNDLWECVRGFAEEGDYIFIVDADEFYNYTNEETKLQCKGEVIAIRLCDMWNEKEYRIDGYWSPYFHRLFKYKDEPFSIEGNGLHLSAVPKYVQTSKNIYMSNLRCEHRSYVRDKDKKTKYDFYMENSQGSFNLNHARSIFNKKPELKTFIGIDYPKILITSLIHNREWVLPEFINCLKNINYPKDKISYCFVVNNTTDKSLDLLKKHFPEALILEYNFERGVIGEHKWDNVLIHNMAIMRNATLEIAEKTGVDYMINIDSDILFPPELIKHLVSSDRKIISPVFFAGWNSNNKLPQVWDRGGYELSESLLDIVKNHKTLVQVGGLGAFTCIHKDVWNKGVNYTRVKNLPSDMFGEDRDFCIRAVCAGFDLWASSYFDLIHVDNQKMLEELKRFKKYTD